MTDKLATLAGKSYIMRVVVVVMIIIIIIIIIIIVIIMIIIIIIIIIINYLLDDLELPSHCPLKKLFLHFMQLYDFANLRIRS